MSGAVDSGGLVARTTDILGWRFSVIAFAETKGVAQPCVYLMAHEDVREPGVHRIHYAGQTHNLGERFVGHHRLEAAIALGATHVLALMVVREVDRRALETLLRYEFRPPLNEEVVPTHVQGWRAAQYCGRMEIAAKARSAHLKEERQMLPPWTRMPTTARR
jgi:hypothetical protein